MQDDDTAGAGDAQSADRPVLEVDFDVVTEYHPRRIRLRVAQAVQEYDLPCADGPEDRSGTPGGAPPEDEALTLAALWAYYLACDAHSRRRPLQLPWKTETSRRWRAFVTMLLADPERPTWWGDPVKRVERIRTAYARARRH